MKKIIVYFVAIVCTTFLTGSCKKESAAYANAEAHSLIVSIHGGSIRDNWLSKGEKLIVDSVAVYDYVSEEEMKIESVTYCMDDETITTAYQSPFGCEFTIGDSPIGLPSVGLHTLFEIIKVDGGEEYGEFCDTLYRNFRIFADTTQLWTCSVDKKQLKNGDEDTWVVVISVDSTGIYKEVGGSFSSVSVCLGDMKLSLKPKYDYTKICLTNKSLNFISDGNWHAVTGTATYTGTDGATRREPWTIEAEGWREMSSYPERSELTVLVHMDCELDEKCIYDEYVTIL